MSNFQGENRYKGVGNVQYCYHYEGWITVDWMGVKYPEIVLCNT